MNAMTAMVTTTIRAMHRTTWEMQKRSGKGNIRKAVGHHHFPDIGTIRKQLHHHPVTKVQVYYRLYRSS